MVCLSNFILGGRLGDSENLCLSVSRVRDKMINPCTVEIDLLSHDDGGAMRMGHDQRIVLLVKCEIQQVSSQTAPAPCRRARESPSRRIRRCADSQIRKKSSKISEASKTQAFTAFRRFG